MYKKILVSLSLEHGVAAQALETARQLVDADGEIIVLHVLEQIPQFARQYLEAGQEEKIHNQAMAALEARIGAADDAKAVVLVGHPGRTVSEYAEKIDADCIVIGSHKPGLKDFFLGSTAARIVRHAYCSIHVLR